MPIRLPKIFDSKKNTKPNRPAPKTDYSPELSEDIRRAVEELKKDNFPWAINGSDTEVKLAGQQSSQRVWYIGSDHLKAYYLTTYGQIVSTSDHWSPNAELVRHVNHEIEEKVRKRLKTFYLIPPDEEWTPLRERLPILPLERRRRRLQ